jgi:BTB/POZ domain
MPISAAENYQLKWNSHITNLNSSISNLFKNDKYADVMLFTCNAEEGFYGIPAHKLILGTCSHYFSSIFDNNPMPINSIIYIFLPSELSRRAISTLIQYMYTGEATVSNEILNEVLKGGEILKIRGLCKVHPGTNEPLYCHSKYTLDSASQQQAATSYTQPSYKLVENGPSSLVSASPIKSNKSSLRNSIDKKSSIHNDSGGNGHQQHILTQNESPVVVMTSNPTQPNPPHNNNNNNYAQSSTNNNNLIIVKKDMAIDPDAAAIPVEHYGLISLKIAAAVKKAQQQNVSTIKKSPSLSGGGVEQRREFYQLDNENLRYDDAISSPPAFKVYSTSCEQQQLMTEEALRYTEKKKRIAQNHQKPSSSLMSPSTSTSSSSGGIRESSKSNKYSAPENGQSFTLTAAASSATTTLISHDQHQHFPEALSFLAIKEEPLEWTDFDAAGNSNRTEVITVKPETLEDIENSLNAEANDKVYSPLTCEVCNLKFHLPSAWVRHIESHSELNQSQQPSVPKKRKRVEEVRLKMIVR